MYQISAGGILIEVHISNLIFTLLVNCLRRLAGIAQVCQCQTLTFGGKYDDYQGMQ